MDYSEKQIQIMEAAEKLFAQKGFAGSSVRDIAEAAGVNLAMISYYFGSKEKLMEALVNYRGEYLRLRLQTLLEEDSTPIEKVEKLIDDYVDRKFHRKCFHLIMLREQMESADGPLSGIIFQMKKTNFELITKLVREGQEKGDFRPDVDVSLLMVTLLGTTSHMVTSQNYYCRLNGLPEMPDAELETLLKAKLSSHLKKIFKEILTYDK